MYGRGIEGEDGEARELSFEASGALMDASLVMRDRETDSWWSIMTSDAIGGPLAGTELDELPISEKTTWGEWKRRHPDTLALSVGGTEHVDRNPYETYFTSGETFRNQEVADDRLPPKEPIYAFQLDGRPWAVPHSAIEGGRVFRVPGESGGPARWLAFHREPGSAVYASSRAWMLDHEVEEVGASPPGGAAPLDGFDTYWYTWVAVHEESGLLGDSGR